MKVAIRVTMRVNCYTGCCKGYSICCLYGFTILLVYGILTCFDIRVWCCRIWRVGLVRDLIMRLGVFVHGVSGPLVCFGTRQGGN